MSGLDTNPGNPRRQNFSGASAARLVCKALGK